MKTQISLARFLAGIYLWMIGVNLFLSIIVLALLMLLAPQIPDTYGVLFREGLNVIGSVTSIFLAVFVASKRYYLPASPQRIASMFTGVNFVLSIVPLVFGSVFMPGIFGQSGMITEIVVSLAILLIGWILLYGVIHLFYKKDGVIEISPVQTDDLSQLSEGDTKWNNLSKACNLIFGVFFVIAVILSPAVILMMGFASVSGTMMGGPFFIALLSYYFVYPLSLVLSSEARKNKRFGKTFLMSLLPLINILIVFIYIGIVFSEKPTTTVNLSTYSSQRQQPLQQEPAKKKKFMCDHNGRFLMLGDNNEIFGAPQDHPDWLFTEGKYVNGEIEWAEVNVGYTALLCKDSDGKNIYDDLVKRNNISPDVPNPSPVTIQVQARGIITLLPHQRADIQIAGFPQYPKSILNKGDSSIEKISTSTPSLLIDGIFPVVSTGGSVGISYQKYNVKTGAVTLRVH